MIPDLPQIYFYSITTHIDIISAWINSLTTPWAVVGFCFFILGATIGSFLNVIAYRTVEEEKWAWAKGRSKCPSCKKVIPFYFNTPIIGWAILRGKSACCGESISPRYILVEFVSGILFALIGMRYGITPETGFLLIAVSAAIVASLIDYDTMILPDSSNLVIFLSSIMAAGFIGHSHGKEIFEMLWFLIVWPLETVIVGVGIFLFLYMLLRKGAYGMGDVKLLAACSPVIGPAGIVAAIQFAAVAMVILIIALYPFIRDKETLKKVPFGPGLAVGWVIALLSTGPMFII